MSIKVKSSKHAAKQAINSDELLRKAAEAVALPPVASIWDDLVSHLGRTLKVDWVFIAKLLPGAETQLRTLAAWHRGDPVEDLDYQLSVPFDDPSMPDVCVYVSSARKHLQNAWLKQVKAQSFGHVKLIGPLGQALGMLAIAHARALESAETVEAILRIYAFKAVVELEREVADERFYRQVLDTLHRTGPNSTD